MRTFFDLHAYTLRFLYIQWRVESQKKGANSTDKDWGSGSSTSVADYNRIMFETWTFTGVMLKQLSVLREEDSVAELI